MPVPKVSEQWAEDVIVTIVEGGSSYWADFECKDGKWELIESEASEPDGKVRRIVLDRDAIQKGIDALTTKKVGCHGQYVGTILASVIADDGGDIDATEADIVAQAALFDALVYG